MFIISHIRRKTILAVFLSFLIGVFVTIGFQAKQRQNKALVESRELQSGEKLCSEEIMQHQIYHL